MPKVPESLLSEIKAAGPIARVLESRGVTLHRQGRDLVCCCPLPDHDDKTPSFHITEANGESVAHCFGCDWAGTVFQLLQKLDGCSFLTAVDVAARAVGVAFDPSRYQPPVRRAQPDDGCPLDPEADDAALSAQVIGFYHNRLLRSGNAAWSYLTKRGLGDMALARRYSLGYAERGALGRLLPNKQTSVGRALRARLEEMGWFKAGTGHETFSGRVIVPVLDADGGVVGCYGRALGPLKGAPIHRNQNGGHRGIWNAAAFRPGGPVAAEGSVVLCEAALDGLTFARWGVDNVTACLGVNAFLPAHLDAFSAANVRDVFVAYDNDDAGNKATVALVPQLVEAGLTVYRVALPPGGDVNELAVSAGDDAPAALVDAIRQGEWLGGARPVSVPELPADVAPASSPVAEAAPEPEAVSAPAPSVSGVDDVTESETGDALTVRMGNRRWRIRGLQACETSMALKVELRVWVGDDFHQDQCDLANHRQRSAFAAAAGREMAVIQSALISADLKRLLLFSEEWLEARQAAQAAEASAPAIDPADAMSDDERAEALALLRDPGLADRIVADLETCGLVGERVNKLTAYLAATSRRMDAPLAVLVQSSSAAGKTTLMDAVLALMPDEEARRYSALSPKALYYLGHDQLRHQILAIAEEEGAEAASYSLKLLQSDGSLVFASPIKQPDGSIKTEEIRIDGPVMLFLTTTKTDIADGELENRCVKLTVDEDAEQTAAIHHRQRLRDTWDGIALRKSADAAKAVHRNAQRLLRPLAVINPYAPRLSFATGRARLRRDHQKYLDLIKAVTFLHQFQRPKENRTIDGVTVEAVITTPEDIRLANELAHVALGRSLDDLPPQLRRILGLLWDVVHPMASAAGCAVSRFDWELRQVLPSLPVGDSHLRSLLRALAGRDYVASYRAHAAEPMKYRLLCDERPADRSHLCLGLIDPATIRASDSPLGVNDAPLGARWGSVGDALGVRLGSAETAQTPDKINDSSALPDPAAEMNKRGPKPGPVVPKMETEAKRQNRGA